jgi:SH3-like domain-containing protein
MGPSVAVFFLKMLCCVRRLAAQRGCVCPRFWTWVMLISLTMAILPRHAVAETTGAPPSNVVEQAPPSLQRGTLTLMSNLRASPSTQSEIVATVKEGTQVEILQETDRWYRVRSEQGVEAWIYKPLVSIKHKPSKLPSTILAAVTQPDVKDTSSESAAEPHVSAESQPEKTPEHPGSGTSYSAPIGVPYVLSERVGTEWFIAAILSHVQGLGVYVVIALVMILVLSIVLQLCAARQLRQAMREMGEILNVVEEIYADTAIARANDRSIAMDQMAAEISAHQPPHPVIEYSPIEYAALESLSDQREVQEGELAKLVAEKGFTGVMLKAVIGDIVHKTGTVELPWVEVRYAQGRYSYRLRPEAMANLSKQQSENR